MPGLCRFIMAEKTILNIGFDDTDSPSGMCTTFLAYKMVESLSRNDAEFLDFPRLVRFNPNIPWKTRGNGAVSIRLKTGNPAGIKKRIRAMVSRYSDIKNGANPGLVFLEGDKIPPQFADFGRLALWQLVRRNDAKKFARQNRLDHTWMGNGQGLVGAIGAAGYDFGDHTLELLSYRKRSRFGTRRKISAQSVKKMQEITAPNTFSSYDVERDRVMITPHGPDPVFYGIRGEGVAPLLRAIRILRTDEKLDGHMIFRSNQGTGDHLHNELDPAMSPYSSGVVNGLVSTPPRMLRGGHVMFAVLSGNHEFWCMVYKPTGMTTVAAGLITGDRIRVGGGVRRASGRFPRVINLEFIKVINTARDTSISNPTCISCAKKMKSKGKNQGFECVRCGKRHPAKIHTTTNRALKRRLYIPDISAHRHLTRPLQRMGRTNTARFDGSLEWFCVYKK
ncbi:MAG: DUF1743 domain-containing protein [Nitrosopumilus sp. D6]|nr:MAG: DUF1743 domain-containing protein [Nitrosopumilus sp. D6]